MPTKTYPNIEKYSIENIKNYLIDCLGYGETDLHKLNKSELWDMIDKEKDFKLYYTPNN